MAEDPTTKAELLTLMRDGYADFAKLLVPLSETQLTTTGVNGDWSVKDILVHLTAWQLRVCLRLESIISQTPTTLESIASDEQMDAFNATIFSTNRDRALSEVLEEFHSVASRLIADVEAVSSDDLFTEGRFEWLGGGVLWGSVAGNTYGHYEEHAPMITEWLAHSVA